MRAPLRLASRRSFTAPLLIAACAGGCLMAACGGQRKPAAPANPEPPAAQPATTVASEPPSAATSPSVSPPASTGVESFRPAWWIDEPRHTEGRAQAAAMADDADLREARRRAVAAARAAIGPEAPATPTRVESVRLPDGRFRVFVLVTSGE